MDAKRTVYSCLNGMETVKTMTTLYCIMLIVAPSTEAYIRSMQRESILVKEFKNCTSFCLHRANILSMPADFSFVRECAYFRECTSKECISVPECVKKGGDVEYPFCEYGRMNKMWHSWYFFQCVKKFIQTDHKSKCQANEHKTNCNEFVKCCLKADSNACKRFPKGELEYPACDLLQRHSKFYPLKDYELLGQYNYSFAVCRCATDSPISNRTFSTAKTASQNFLAQQSSTAGLKLHYWGIAISEIVIMTMAVIITVRYLYFGKMISIGTIMTTLFLIILMLVKGMNGYERKVLRERVDIEGTENWAATCTGLAMEKLQPFDLDKACVKFNECCNEYPNKHSIDKCDSNNGTIMEHPTCNYKSSLSFPLLWDCNCVQKTIKVDHKKKCQSSEHKKNCKQFLKCCIDADNDACAKLATGELEQPACNKVVGPFDYNEAVCRCVVDSGNTTALRITPTYAATQPRVALQTTTSRGEKQTGKCLSSLATIVTVVVVVAKD